MLQQLFKLAWRNIWRNKRRAFITIISIVVSLFFVLALRQMQLWTYENNLKETISGYVGYIQLTDAAFVDEEILDNTLAASQIPIEKLRNIEGVSGVFPRFQTGALVSTGIRSRFAGVLGITPSIDDDELNLSKKIVEGTLLTDTDVGIMITKKMSQYYQVGVGDTLIIFGQGYQGYTAAGLYPIKAVLNIVAGDMASMLFMSMPEVQRLYVAPDRYTSYLINLENGDAIEKVKAEVLEVVNDPTLVVRTWYEVLPGLKQGLQLDSGSGLIIAGILYMIVGFGIFGTVVMLYNERLFEFGILSALGMNRFQILATTIIELNILSLIGVLLGNLLVFPLVYYFNVNPYELVGDMAEAITEKGFEPMLGTGLYLDVFVVNSLTIMLISALVSSYIIYKIIQLNPLEAMRQH